MTAPGPRLVGSDPETPISVLRRFAITTVDQSLEECTVSASMPVAQLA